ncbi:sugar ABC transporter permease [Salibacterium halotolerans]|uniref:Xylose transport system permease protein XylH n=1 Tax=Salibacterium halotolerans TaxID=1884432 RepID=A0A1I5L2Q4_9BACI|nr:sugar ABC transporter permease [Salibacterium halotolerans]SFO91468.1 D-xylose transport system permease protein [Salibacterium halotolerans]
MLNKLSFKMNIRAYALIIAFLLIVTIFTILTNGDFLTSRNITNLMRQMTVIGVLAVGMTSVIISGNIDLSVGSLLGLTGGIAAILQVWLGWNTVWVIIATIAAGVLLGLWQGWWIAYRGIPAFIVTLAGMMIFRGILLGISGGQTIASLDPGFMAIGQSYLPYSIGYILTALFILSLFTLKIRSRQKSHKLELVTESVFVDYGKLAVYSGLCLILVYYISRYQGIPMPMLILTLLALLFIFILNNTAYGRHLYSIGGNHEAALLSGINIKRNTLMVFVLMGALSAVAGIILTSRLNAATISAGEMYELDAIAAVVIGGTSLMGGTGTIIGSILGALIMTSIDNGMSMLNVETFWQNIVKGMILILAVWLDISSKK